MHYFSIFLTCPLLLPLSVYRSILAQQPVSFPNLKSVQSSSTFSVAPISLSPSLSSHHLFPCLHPYLSHLTFPDPFAIMLQPPGFLVAPRTRQAHSYHYSPLCFDCTFPSYLSADFTSSYPSVFCSVNTSHYVLKSWGGRTCQTSV